MFKSSSFKKLQRLIEELGRIAAETGTYLTEVYTKSSGSYTRIKWRYNTRLFSAEYPNSHKNKRGLHSAYLSTRQGLNSIGLSKAEVKSLSKGYVGKNVVLSEKLFEVWKHLEKERWGILWWVKI
tara:strand:- start:24 stop:398 length:375 start_codon:yes stop_codon:yes gene_type:complete